MTLAMILAFLTGHHFETACVQTQDNGKSGYAVDSVHFERGGKVDEDELMVVFTRQMYQSEDCTSGADTPKMQRGRVKLRPASDSFFSSINGEERFDADWSMNPPKASEVELGSIGINPKTSVLRIARNTPGFFRNTMLQIIGFQGTTR